MSQAQCASCGAPESGELVYCRYCSAPLSAEILANAIPCPRCRTACRWGRQHCGACQAWIVVSCVFCGALSPCNLQACLQCHEVFAGAPERRAQREQQARGEHPQQANQETLQIVGTVGSIAASFLGAIVGAELGDDS